MADSVQRVTEQGWGSRLGGAFKGIVAGLIMVVLGVILLFWGEGRAVRRAQALKEGEKTAISISAEAPIPEDDGRLVHLSGQATSDALLRDPELGAESRGLKLYRMVEMYQWKESSSSKTEKKIGGGTRTVTTYDYSRVWSEQGINSSSFEEPSGHENPTFPIHGESWIAEPITVGELTLTRTFVGKISKRRPVDVAGIQIPSEIQGRPTRIAGGKIHLGGDPSSPRVGDVRISFNEVPETEVSIIGMQQNSEVRPYQTSNGQTLALLVTGLKAKDEMFQAAKASNNTLTWILRAVGFFLIFIGFSTVLKPLSVLADVIPLFGNVAEAGTRFVSFLMAGVVSLVTIALGWLFYRPLLGISLLAGAAVFLFWLVKKLLAARPKATSPAPPPPPASAPPPPPPPPLPG